MHAQKVYQGIVVSGNDKPIEGVDILIDDEKNAFGKFEITLKKGFNDIKDVGKEAKKAAGFDFSSFRLIVGKIKIVLIEKGKILEELDA